MPIRTASPLLFRGGDCFRELPGGRHPRRTSDNRKLKTAEQEWQGLIPEQLNPLRRQQSFSPSSSEQQVNPGRPDLEPQPGDGHWKRNRITNASKCQIIALESSLWNHRWRRVDHPWSSGQPSEHLGETFLALESSPLQSQPGEPRQSPELLFTPSDAVIPDPEGVTRDRPPRGTDDGCFPITIYPSHPIQSVSALLEEYQPGRPGEALLSALSFGVVFSSRPCTERSGRFLS